MESTAAGLSVASVDESVPTAEIPLCMPAANAPWTGCGYAVYADLKQLNLESYGTDDRFSFSSQPSKMLAVDATEICGGL
jgi:hypothetical protein